MKKSIIILMALALISCSKVEWQTITNEDANITIEFPGNPTHKTEMMNNPYIGRMKFNTYKYKNEDVTFLLQITEMLDQDISEESLYDSIHTIKRRALKKGGEIIKELENEESGNETYLISVKRDDGSAMHQKMIKSGNEQYLLSVYYKNGDSDEEEVNKFYNSLVL